MNFLQNVAHDLLRRFGTDLHRVTVVFPNKRASLFLNKYLAEQSKTPVWSPAYITISELFRSHSSLTVDNQISLICRLYDVFVRQTGFENEPLDNFYGWGQLLLADFDDLDKNMAPADKVFSIVSDLHSYDTAEYLTKSQKEVLKHFFESFSDDHTSKMQQKFMNLWNKLFDIYSQYRESLIDNGLAYEGMLYRQVVENLNDNDDVSVKEKGNVNVNVKETYCFVGFNMLQTCEQKLFRHLHDHALYYWDYSDFYLDDNHEAGHFIKQYLSLFPNALQDDTAVSPFLPSKGDASLTYISTPTENLQGRFVTRWLLENDRWKDGEHTAIIMCDERLLQTVLTALPDCVDKVNITTGYPLAQTQAATLVSQLIELQQAGHVIGTDKYRLRQVLSVLKHPYSRHFYDEVESVVKELKENHRYYPSREELAVPSSGLTVVFEDLDTIEIRDVAYIDQNLRLVVWLTEVIRYVAMKVDDDFESEALFRMYKVLQQLYNLISTDILKVDHNTLQRLLGQIINTTTIPFHGEPVQGIQIMGVLESRCLDFDHVLLLSCNEGNMPKGEGDSSFIPHSVRRAYNLTTVDNKVGIYSYYFHRLLQRCPDTSITYNSSTEGMNTGEMSRFMLQLQVECDGIKLKTLTAGQSATAGKPTDIPKTPDILHRIMSVLTCDKGIYPSSLANYLRCQARYYYQHIACLREVDDNDVGDMDNVALGNVFHAAAQIMFEELRDQATHVVTQASLDALSKDESYIERIVDKAFTKEFFKITDDNDHHPEYNGLQLINRKVIIRLMKNLIDYDKRYAPIKILLLEEPVYAQIPIKMADGSERLVNLGGKIDRLDEVTDPVTMQRMIRVVDYKTGSHEPSAIPSVADVFNHDMVGSPHHADYFLQTMLYSYIVSQDNTINPNGLPVSPQLFYVQNMWNKDFNPVLCVKKDPNDRSGSTPIFDIRDYNAEYLQCLKQLIYDITNPSIPFKSQYDSKSCSAFCPFIELCKR